ncbi:hypothetical protein FBU30_010082 [Linnemannia zychae]|nr:hypothetical protein FBU30_010082 [Linnemannia zychae]
MNDLPPFVQKYVSRPYYDQLNWSEKTAYLKGIQDVMKVFNKELQDRAMLVLQTKAHWLEPRTSAPIEYFSSQSSQSQSTVSQSQPSSSQTQLTSSQSSQSQLASSQSQLASSQIQQTAKQQLAALQAAHAAHAARAAQQAKQGITQSFTRSQPTASQSSQSKASQPHRAPKAAEAAPLDKEIAFVGMKYRGGHEFSPSDRVRLERDPSNPVDMNAIKVMVYKKGKWDHVAYVGRDDANALKDQLGIEHMKLTYLRAYAASVKYRLQA